MTLHHELLVLTSGEKARARAHTHTDLVVVVAISDHRRSALTENIALKTNADEDSMIQGVSLIRIIIIIYFYL